MQYLPPPAVSRQVVPAGHVSPPEQSTRRQKPPLHPRVDGQSPALLHDLRRHVPPTQRVPGMQSESASQSSVHAAAVPHSKGDLHVPAEAPQPLQMPPGPLGSHVKPLPQCEVR